ncbi:hypothetical protein Tco_0824583 [Tanacetum coccineum]|uniref:Myb-like domain-containing protein n=1 Tax=Tanacetum coccineum TaxID=301880 RepID=A0ABQ5AR69_9ASTR
MTRETFKKIHHTHGGFGRGRERSNMYGEDPIRTVQRWTHEEEKLLCECWVEVFKNNKIGSDRTEESFWWQITDDFNQATQQGFRTKDMITGK